jgi:hypothetical protein
MEIIYHLIVGKRSTQIFCLFNKEQKKKLQSSIEALRGWEHKDSNLGPPACKAGALNQLSYAPSCPKRMQR